MSLSASSLENLQDHWAVQAVGNDDLARSVVLVNERLALGAVGTQIAFNFEEGPSDERLLERVSLAYELAAMEGLAELSRPAGSDVDLRQQATAAAFRAFDLRRTLTIPTDTRERLFFVLHLSALAYSGERWSDLRRWYNDNDKALTLPDDIGVQWDCRLLYRLFDCWVRLFRKQGWVDLDGIRKTIADLREDQKVHEEQQLQEEPQTEIRAIAFRLAALYHWAKATEILAEYMLQGVPGNPISQIDRHFEAAIKAATASADAQHEIILRWLHTAGNIMVANSLWWATRGINSLTTGFVRSLSRREHRPLFELLPPQRAALLEQGLLDQAKTAIVVDLPTSGGKTLLAQFRILQALNQFRDDGGWVAYVAPTRALCAQLTRQLRRDFDPIGLRTEQLTAAIDVDAFEEELLTNQEQPFDILVATPEKLSLLIRNSRVSRPMALIVMDEAHNLESEGRGLRIELLLATIKRDCPQANFLLMMPFVESSESIARWLAQDTSASQSINLSTTPWKPNERLIGVFRAVEDNSARAGWHLEYEALSLTDKAIHLQGVHRVGGVRPIDVPKSKVLNKGEQKGFSIQTAAIGCLMSDRDSAINTSIAVTNSVPSVWSMARHAMNTLPPFESIPAEVRLVQDFLRTEISSSFELIDMLDHGVGVHHSGLSEEVRSLMEWLTELGKLRVLCATSTIAQGLNFPVSSVFLASRYLPEQKRSEDGTRKSVEIQPREFWNLVGRAGRIGQDSVGVVGLAEGTDRVATLSFVSRNMGALVSRLVTLLDELAAKGQLTNLAEVLDQDQWQDFRCYIAHLWAEKKNLDAVIAESEQLMRQTYGYTTLRNDPAQQAKADALLEATQIYAHRIAEMEPGVAELADATGFSPEGVNGAINGIQGLEGKLVPSDWAPESLFGSGGKMADLFGVMLNIPQLKQELEQIGGKGFDHTRISHITRDWVNGKTLGDIAADYFLTENGKDDTAALTDACRAVYRAVVNSGTWGVSALTEVSQMELDSIPEVERRRIKALPAMIYHGVSSEDAVLMRMNSAPRSAAEHLGEMYRHFMGEDEGRYSVSKARDFLKELSPKEWGTARPEGAQLSGDGYKAVWEILSGEGDRT